MAEITYVPKAPAPRFQFHDPNGSLVSVEAGGFSTEDPALIAFLDSTPAVERKGAAKLTKKEEED